MVNINFFITDGYASEMFHEKFINSFNTEEYLNMDNVRFFLIDYIPDHLKGEEYRIRISEKYTIVTIDVYFEYNKYIARDLKIKKILND